MPLHRFYNVPWNFPVVYCKYAVIFLTAPSCFHSPRHDFLSFCSACDVTIWMLLLLMVLRTEPIIASRATHADSDAGNSMKLSSSVIIELPYHKWHRPLRTSVLRQPQQLCAGSSSRGGFWGVPLSHWEESEEGQCSSPEKKSFFVSKRCILVHSGARI